MKLKKFWKGLKHWQKGGIIGFMIGILLMFSLALFGPLLGDRLDPNSTSTNFILSTIFFTLGLPYYLVVLLFSGLYLSDGSLLYAIILGFFSYSMFGALIGLIIGKIKGNRKKFKHD